MRSVQAGGALSEKTKELILFSLVLQSRCRPCFGTHYQRARELGITQAELDEAVSHNDSARVDNARSEIDALEGELSAAFGLGGRRRDIGSPAERARQSVTKALREALRRIAHEDAVLGDHLVHSVRTGLYCVYDPDPVAAPRWTT